MPANQISARTKVLGYQGIKDSEQENTVFAIPNDSELADSGIKLKKRVSEVSIGSAVFADERKKSYSLK